MNPEYIQELALSKLDSEEPTWLRYSAESLRDKKNLVVAEIGVENGTNAFRLLSNLDIKKMYLIDWYRPQPQYGYTEEMVAQQRKHSHEILAPWKDKIVWLEMDSVEAKEFIIDELDYTYIDGDHTFEGVYRDIVAYYPITKGIISGHDFTSYDECRNGVMKFALENDLICSFKFQDWKYLSLTE